jgi:SAM-dependent methyltransferase
MKSYIILFFFTILISTQVVSAPFESCPVFNDEYVLTQNDNGNSTYTSSGFADFLKSLHNATKFDLEKPILDVGAGYGGATFQLIKLGARNIYFNDLDIRNIKCASKYLEKVFGNKVVKIKYIPGDISNEEVISKLPDDKFSLIYAIDVIHFFKTSQLFRFIQMMNQKASKGAIVVIAFENKYIEQLNKLITNIFDAHEKFPNVPIDIVVKHGYNKATIFHMNRTCSFKAYKQAPYAMKIPGFPCEIPVDSGTYQLLSPVMVKGLMEAGGFRVLDEQAINNEYKMFLFTFKLDKKLKKEVIYKRIKEYLKYEFKHAEQMAKKTIKS